MVTSGIPNFDQSSMTVTGLTAGETYRFFVRSVTRSGGATPTTYYTSPWVTAEIGMGAGIVLSKLGVEIGEDGATDSYTVKLHSAPSDTVTVAVSSNDTNAATVSPASLEFTTTDWSTAQTVTVTGVNDAVDNENDERTVTLTHSATSSDSGYHTRSASLTATVTDDDTRGLTLSKSALTVVEDAGTNSYTVVLDPEPTDAVTVTVTSDDATAAEVSADATTYAATATLTFTTATWDATQTVTVRGVNDDLDNPGDQRQATLSHAAASDDDDRYDGLTGSSITVTVTVTDDDVETPTNVEVQVGNASLGVSWTDGAGADSHTVRYRTTSTPWTTLENAVSPYKITGLTNDDEYEVQVGAVHGEITHWADAVNGTPSSDAGTLGTLDSVRATPDNGAVGLSWQMPDKDEDDEDGQSVGGVVGFGSASGNAQSNNQSPSTQESYEVGYTVEGEGWGDGGSQTVTDTATSISGLDNGVTYAFRVCAQSDDETGPWSATVTATPGATADRPTDVTIDTDTSTAWKTLDLSFSAPPDGLEYVAANSQYRVLGVKEGASWTDWTTVAGASVSGDRVSGSTVTGSLAIGRVYEVEVRWCGETSSDDACSEASDSVYGATPASVPTNAKASATDAASQTALKLAGSIDHVGGKNNLQAAYELGYATDTEATAPATLVEAADVPAFGSVETEIAGLAAGTEYRLFVRSVIEHESERHFASVWVSATAITEAVPTLELCEAPDDPQWPVGEVVEALVLPAATGGTGEMTYSLDPSTWNGLSFDATTRELSGTPEDGGSGAFTYTATDEADETATLTFTVTVVTVPSFEDVEAPALSFTAGEAITEVTLPAATGGDGKLTYAVTPALGNGLSFDAATRVISGTPESPADTATWTLTATDADGDTATLAFTIFVKEDLKPSYGGIDSPALEFTEDEVIEPATLPVPTGGDGELTYALNAALGNGLSFDAATRAISGTPESPADTAIWTLTATDADGDTATLAFTIFVKEDLKPSYEGVDSPALSFTAGETVDPVTLPAAKGGDGTLTYSLSPALGAGLSFDSATRIVSGTPTAQADTVTYTLTATDADGDTATLAFTVTVAAPSGPEHVETHTTPETVWKSLDLSFDAPPASSAWVAENSQIRVLGMKPGATRTGWRSFETVTVEDGRVHASTGGWLAIGRVYEVEVRWCDDPQSDDTCSAPSDMVYGTSPASAPTDAGTSSTDPVSETALLLQWDISPIGGNKNLQAAYEIGYSTNTDAEAPETLLADVPAFGTKETEIDGLESGTAYRLYVRSVIDWQGTRHFASDWASATATTLASAESLARQQLQGELAKHARALLEDASTVIGQRFTAVSAGGEDALTALASVFGGAGGSACPRQVALGDCLPQPGIGQAGEPWDPERGYQPPMTTQGQGLGTLLQRLQTQNFSLSLNRTLLGETDDAPQPVQLALWGSGGTAFQGSQGQRFVGLDARLGTEWMTGVAVAQGGTAFQPIGGDMGGELGSSLTTVYPYLRGQLSDTLAVWSLAGWGWGDLTSRWQNPYQPDQTVTLDGALGLNLALVGVEQTVYAGDGLNVAVVGDYGWSQLAVSGIAGGALGAVVHRSRLGVTSDYASPDGALRGTLQLSGRLDGGAGERAQGAEVTGSLHYGLGSWTGGVTGHWYGATQALAGVAAQGLQLVLERRAATDGTGWTGRLAPGWGTAAPGAGTPLLAAVGTGGLLGGVAGAPTLRVDGQVAWGLRLGEERGLLVRPFANVGVAAAGQQVRAGIQLEGPVQLNLTVEHLRRPTAPATAGVLLQVDTTF